MEVLVKSVQYVKAHFPPLINKAVGPGREGYPPRRTVKWVESQEGFYTNGSACFAMSIARREMFLNFHYKLIPNSCSSDHHWSYRLQRAGIKVWTHPDAFVKHLRRGWGLLGK